MKASIAFACLSAVAFAAPGPAVDPVSELETRQSYGYGGYGYPPPKPNSIIKSIQNITATTLVLDKAILSINETSPDAAFDGVAATLDGYALILNALKAQTPIIKKAALINPRYIPLVQTYIDKLIKAVQKATGDLIKKNGILVEAEYASLVPDLIKTLKAEADNYADALISKVQNVGTDKALAKGDKARVDVAFFNIYLVFGLPGVQASASS